MRLGFFCMFRGGGDLVFPPSDPLEAGSIDVRFALHPLTRDEDTTCTGVLQSEPRARLTVMPTHHMDGDGHLSGFRYVCPGDTRASCLPISRQMFFGHSAVRCLEKEERVMGFMLDASSARDRLATVCEGLTADAGRAVLDCIPENTESIVGNRLVQGTDLRTVDAQDWTPDPPLTVGLYHAYVRGCSRDLRAHQMFLCCSGGLDTAADEFCNLLIDVGDQCSARDAVNSMEAWWLRRASQRARARVLCLAAEALGVCVDSRDDTSSYTACRTSRPCVDTFEHDLCMHSSKADGDVVAVYNGCASTTVRFNGLLVRMAPSDGMRIFRGAGVGVGNEFGSTFGSDRVCGLFPVCQPRVPASRDPSVVCVPDATYVRRQGGTQAACYRCFDEAYHKVLEQMQWNRDNGQVELMPIAVWARDGV